MDFLCVQFQFTTKHNKKKDTQSRSLDWVSFYRLYLGIVPQRHPRFYSRHVVIHYKLYQYICAQIGLHCRFSFAP